MTVERLTTTLIGGSNGTATLCAILGDKHNPRNNGHTIRVVTRSPQRFFNSNNNDNETNNGRNKIREWRCHEQKPLTDVFPLPFLPTQWLTHVGAPHSVFGYVEGDDVSAFESAFAGHCLDDAGVTDVILLSCPVNAHLPLLRKVARALYKLNDEGKLLSNKRDAPPILIGTLYAAGSFDWACRIAFCVEKPPNFQGWKRPLALFGLKSFPYLTKSLKPGHVTLYGRYPDLTVAVAPSTRSVRAHARKAIDRILQNADTGKQMRFIGLSSDVGGDGSGREDIVPGIDGDSSCRSESMADMADPQNSIGFLMATLNSTNQYLHPSILDALFTDENTPEGNIPDGSIEWEGKPTPLPLFYADGASKPEAARLLTAIACGECFVIIDLCEKMLVPGDSLNPISAHFGGEPFGRFAMTFFGNTPEKVAKRSLLPDLIFKKGNSGDNALEGAKDGPTTDDKVNLKGFHEFMMRFGLVNNTRLGSVVAPCYKDPETGRVRPKVDTRFFVDDIPHGYCIYLGLAELMGCDLERDLPEMLRSTRKLQHWMGKEFVVPANQTVTSMGIVGGARDVKETSAPQAFGIKTVEELRDFLSMALFGDNVSARVERKIKDAVVLKGSDDDAKSMLRAKL
mmetsp:Transcript_8904/g.13202  ORF Transcript_8904/g.13202 Transcript_8904/m.13202 type:complete len:625 (-) Transcript_8904:2361-4235(-)